MCGRWVRLSISGRCSSDHELFERSSDHRTFSWPLIAMSDESRAPRLHGIMACLVWIHAHAMRARQCSVQWMLLRMVSTCKAAGRMYNVWPGQTVNKKQTSVHRMHQGSVQQFIALGHGHAPPLGFLYPSCDAICSAMLGQVACRVMLASKLAAKRRRTRTNQAVGRSAAHAQGSDAFFPFSTAVKAP